MEATANQSIHSATLGNMLVATRKHAQERGQTSVAHTREFRNMRRPLRRQDTYARTLLRKFRTVTVKRLVVNPCANLVSGSSTPAIPIARELLAIQRTVAVAPKPVAPFWRRHLAPLAQAFRWVTTLRLAFK